MAARHPKPVTPPTTAAVEVVGRRHAAPHRARPHPPTAEEVGLPPGEWADELRTLQSEAAAPSSPSAPAVPVSAPSPVATDPSPEGADPSPEFADPPTPPPAAVVPPPVAVPTGATLPSAPVLPAGPTNPIGPKPKHSKLRMGLLVAAAVVTLGVAGNFLPAPPGAHKAPAPAPIEQPAPQPQQHAQRGPAAPGQTPAAAAGQITDLTNDTAGDAPGEWIHVTLGLDNSGHKQATVEFLRNGYPAHVEDVKAVGTNCTAAGNSVVCDPATHATVVATYLATGGITNTTNMSVSSGGKTAPQTPRTVINESSMTTQAMTMGGM